MQPLRRALKRGPALLISLLACTPGSFTGDGESTGAADPFEIDCDPAAMDEPCAAYGGEHLCCSTDPSAIDFSDVNAFVTPLYQGRDGVGTPIFSGANNGLSRVGACVATQEVPDALRLAEPGAAGCRVPCNPRWDAAELETVCGSGAICCQMTQLQPEDCVFDPTLGDAGCLRPVTGLDIEGLGGANLTNWGSSSHATHQDPGGVNCQLFVQALPSSVLDAAGLSINDALLACFRHLSVANQHGLCFEQSELAGCPYAGPGDVDACMQLNLDQGLAGCP